MCGIAGIIFKEKAEDSEFQRFENGVHLMSHRGPDNFGVFRKENFALYHYRLSIIDLSEHAHQPFSLAESENKLVYNGELYNFRDIAKKYQLQQETSSDTEILYRSFEKMGLDILSEYNGIFAFAFWNKTKNEITICRDYLGVKPLYFVNTDQYFAFASEAKVLMNYMRELEIDFQALSEFLWYGSSISFQTVVKGIQKLRVGSSLSINTETFKSTEQAYWSVKKDIVDKGEIKVDYDAAKSKTRELLEKAIERQCISDVPVGAYLSGGIDSSAVVALASRYTKNKLNTFSVAFENSPNSELPLARLIAKKYQTNHHEFEVSTRNMEGDLRDLILQYDEPFADPAFIPLHLMAKKNKENTTVVLQGDGGDEVFAGYGRHLDLSAYHKRKMGFWMLSKFAPNPKKRAIMHQRFWALDASSDWERMARQVAQYPVTEPSTIFQPDFVKRLKKTNPFESYKQVYKELTGLDRLQSMLYTDMQIILPHTFNEKVDKVNMYHSIEARVPFLDKDLVEYVMRLPSSYKLRKGITKSFLREIVTDLIPNEVLYGRKMSFGTPMGNWLKTILYDYTKDVFLKSQDNWSHFIRIDFLLQLLETHKSGEKDHSSVLWRSLVLLIWLDHYQAKIKI